MTPAAQSVVNGGLESLVVTASRATVYTNSFGGETVQIDAASRAETARWSNGCSVSLGLAIDEDASLVFVGCLEGTAVALSTGTGEVVSTANVADGVDIIAYGQKLWHLYLNGSTNGVLTVVDVAADGNLSVIATEPTAPSTDSSCVAADRHDEIWVCDANAGQLLRFSDVY